MLRCHHCGAEWTGEPRPGFNAACEACDAHVYVCLNCRHHDPHTSRGCRITTTEPVRHKDRPNFCDDFEFADRPAGGSPDDAKSKSESAREKFDRLFKKP
ncbi:hypothetical protein ACFL09_03125 [Planctomycetota bacterium]